jgi:hypothetical protein
MNLKIFIILILAMLCESASIQDAGAQPMDHHEEYKIKAGFLINFAKFISLPEASFTIDNSHFQVCVLGDSPFDTALSGIESKSVRNRKVILHTDCNVQHAQHCQLLFISASEKDNLQTIHAALADQPILTVSDIEGFAKSGGIIEFVTMGDQISFIINLAMARQQELTVPSILLNLATEVLQ